MYPQSSLAHYCETNILDIPEALFEMRDVMPMLFNDESSIFYKDLERDLVNIEFHTQVPCFIYISAGREVITTSHNESFEVGPGEAIFLPKGLNLFSDYIHAEGRLNAYLVFFGVDVLRRFLSAEPVPSPSITNEEAIHKLEVNRVIKEYFASLHSVYDSLNNSPQLLQLKLLELLHLLGLNDDGRLRRSLQAVQRGREKRNIRRLIDQYAMSDITAKDLAALSGRSVSSFNREFKTIYGVAPKQWLIKRRIDHAYFLLTEKQWSVTAAALEVGYSNVSHFITAFKKRYGKTPHQIKSEK